LNRGVRLYELIKQDQYQPMEMEEQVIVLFAGVRGFIDRIEVARVSEFEKSWLNYIKDNHYAATMGKIKESKQIDKDLDKLLTKLCDEFSANFSK
jgi:F0F1-type ATP synthase alpha subunit